MENPVTWEPVLTVSECALLRQVETSEQDAEDLLVRNLPLLKALENDEDYRGNVGCPHCLYAGSGSGNGFQCKACAWLDAVKNEGLFIDGRLPCCAATFGGVSLHEAKYVVYSSRSEEVEIGCDHYDDEWDRHLQASIAFVRGHIEWACMVLGIIPWKES